MTIITSSTGSYPPIYPIEQLALESSLSDMDEYVHRSIDRAVDEQIELGIDVLVDGQPRNDIVTMFANRLPGYKAIELPYLVVDRIRPADEPITVSDYLYARDRSGDRPLKAHITGPITMARNSRIDSASPYLGRNDPHLVMDLARALGAEARLLGDSGAEIIQIDEPLLVNNTDLSLAMEAINVVVDTGEISTTILHMCGNVVRILRDVVEKASVQIVSMEGKWLNSPNLRGIDEAYLMHHNKQIGLGCIQTHLLRLEKTHQVQGFMELMVNRLGIEGIWAVMPNCGMRILPHSVAYRKLEIMVSAVNALRTSLGLGV